MTLYNRIHRRMMINRTVRELSRLDDMLLSDIGLTRGNLTEMVTKRIDGRVYGHSHFEVKSSPEPVYHAAPVHSGAAA